MLRFVKSSGIGAARYHRLVTPDFRLFMYIVIRVDNYRDVFYPICAIRLVFCSVVQGL